MTLTSNTKKSCRSPNPPAHEAAYAVNCINLRYWNITLSKERRNIQSKDERLDQKVPDMRQLPRYLASGNAKVTARRGVRGKGNNLRIINSLFLQKPKQAVGGGEFKSFGAHM